MAKNQFLCLCFARQFNRELQLNVITFQIEKQDKRKRFKGYPLGIRHSLYYPGFIIDSEHIEGLKTIHVHQLFILYRGGSNGTGFQDWIGFLSVLLPGEDRELDYSVLIVEPKRPNYIYKVCWPQNWNVRRGPEIIFCENETYIQDESIFKLKITPCRYRRLQKQ